jgi:hypothetical protein
MDIPSNQSVLVMDDIAVTDGIAEWAMHSSTLLLQTTISDVISHCIPTTDKKSFHSFSLYTPVGKADSGNMSLINFLRGFLKQEAVELIYIENICFQNSDF